MRDLDKLILARSQHLEGLREASKMVTVAQDTLNASRALRDDWVRSAYDGGISVLNIMRETGLSREAIYKITHKGSSL